jgi:hypothetical protein
VVHRASGKGSSKLVNSLVHGVGLTVKGNSVVATVYKVVQKYGTILKEIELFGY